MSDFERDDCRVELLPDSFMERCPPVFFVWAVWNRMKYLRGLYKAEMAAQAAEQAKVFAFDDAVFNLQAAWAVA